MIVIKAKLISLELITGTKKRLAQIGLALLIGTGFFSTANSGSINHWGDDWSFAYDIPANATLRSARLRFPTEFYGTRVSTFDVNPLGGNSFNNVMFRASTDDYHNRNLPITVNQNSIVGTVNGRTEHVDLGSISIWDAGRRILIMPIYIVGNGNPALR